MIIKNVTNIKYIKPESIPADSFFYDEIGSNLYYLAFDNNEYLILCFDSDGINAVNRRMTSREIAIKAVINDTSRLILLSDSDVELDYKLPD